MCGIAGYWDSEAASHAERLERLAHRMTDAMAHRGPDDHAVWVDAAAGIALGHRRLSVIAPGPGGRQPMTSSCGRLVLVYNGEVYNFRQLRRRLQDDGVMFRGETDTEVVLEAVARWGLGRAIESFVGMFAFAVWDRGERELHLVRDRLGIKPLTFGWTRSGRFVFASEAKAICALDEFDRRMNRGLLPLFFELGYMPAPNSAWTGLQVVSPATVVTLTTDDVSRRTPRVTQYWSVDRVVRQNRTTGVSIGESVERLEAQMLDSVRLRLESDVPLGAFLSGGVDSATVVALLGEVAPGRVRTFTVGFEEAAYDESRHAAAIATHLGTDHTEVVLSERQALETVPQIPAIWDEPFADSSQIPTLLVSKIARDNVTVALSGDGGDELFGGYTRYRVIAEHWRRARHLPSAVRRLAAWLASTTADRCPDGVLALSAAVFHRPSRQIRDGLRWRSRLLRENDLSSFYRAHASYAVNPELDGLEAGWRVRRDLPSARVPLDRHAIEAMMAHDLGRYLPDDILTKVDRASMAVSLEARVPLLDHRVVELAWRLPLEHNLSDGLDKLVLRRLLARRVPEELFTRPKQGFAIPVEEWVRNGLRDWAEDLLSHHALESSGILDPTRIREAWREHLAKRRDHRNLLWPVLMFQAWHRYWRAV
jgi:asparagine synthase (glutamine-hydrolysing)